MFYQPVNVACSVFIWLQCLLKRPNATFRLEERVHKSNKGKLTAELNVTVQRWAIPTAACKDRVARGSTKRRKWSWAIKKGLLSNQYLNRKQQSFISELTSTCFQCWWYLPQGCLLAQLLGPSCQARAFPWYSVPHSSLKYTRLQNPGQSGHWKHCKTWQKKHNWA